jgi:DNA-binding winged helix-turn-helix (wHTH) protein/CheY-like chemotaxis protein
MPYPPGTPPSETRVFLLGEWRVYPLQNRIESISTGEARRLEPKVMDVLRSLAANAGQTVSRDDLLATVWQGRVVIDGALGRVIRALRAALGDDARQPSYIETVNKRGYRLLKAPQIEPAIAAAVRSPTLPVAHARGVRVNHIVRGVALLGVAALALLLLPGMADSRRVLWVDDQPDRNQREIATLRQMGIVVDTALSNEQAAQRLRSSEYAVLISDMKRRVEVGNAGLRLPLEAIPDRNRLPPVVYYVSKVDSPRTPEGYPVTSRPLELFALVQDLVGSR